MHFWISAKLFFFFLRHLQSWLWFIFIYFAFFPLRLCQFNYLRAPIGKSKIFTRYFPSLHVAVNRRHMCNMWLCVCLSATVCVWAELRTKTEEMFVLEAGLFRSSLLSVFPGILLSASVLLCPLAHFFWVISHLQYARYKPSFNGFKCSLIQINCASYVTLKG